MEKQTKHAELHAHDLIPTYKLNELLGFSLTVEQLISCGAHPVFTTKTGAFWRRKDIPVIAGAIKIKMDTLIMRHSND